MADIPIDLIGEILCRCPVKSVIRFKTVSPAWSTLISSTDFVSKHLRCSRAPILIHVLKPQPLTQTLYSYGIRSLKPNVDDVVHVWGGYPGHDTITKHRPEFIGSPNGVICVVRHPHSFTLYNPITRSTLPLPAPLHHFNSAFHNRIRVGMGFDPSSGDYKIVRLVEGRADRPDKVEVFSVNRGQWTVPTTRTWRIMMTDAHCVVAKGVPYWVGIREVPERSACKRRKRSAELEKAEKNLVSFDVGNERFRTDDFPWEKKRSRTLLGVRDDCLCAMVWDKGVMNRFDLWVMEPVRWNLRYEGVELRDRLVPLFCGDRGIVCREEGRVIVFDPTGVEDEVVITTLQNFHVDDCVRVLGWNDGLTEIPRLGPGPGPELELKQSSSSL